VLRVYDIFSGDRNARKIYYDTGFISVLIGIVIKYSVLVEAARDSEE
jgi:hypothetical protein